MDISFFNNIKSCESAFLKAYNVYNGSVKSYDYEYLQSFQGNTRMSIPVKLVNLYSGIFYFDIKQDSLADSDESSDEHPLLTGVLNPHAKVVDDLEYRHYKLVINYEKGCNQIRARYSADNNSQVVFCDYRILNDTSENDFFKFQITIIRSYRVQTSENGPFHRMFSFFLKSRKVSAEENKNSYYSLLIAEDLCTQFVEYNPMRNDIFPKDERKTHVFHFNNSGNLQKGEILFNEGELQYSPMTDENIRNISKKYFGFDFQEIRLDYAALIEKIMRQVDKKESIDLAEYVFTSCK